MASHVWLVDKLVLQCQHVVGAKQHTFVYFREGSDVKGEFWVLLSNLCTVFGGTIVAPSEAALKEKVRRGLGVDYRVLQLNDLEHNALREVGVLVGHSASKAQGAVKVRGFLCHIAIAQQAWLPQHTLAACTSPFTCAAGWCFQRFLPPQALISWPSFAGQHA